MINDNSISLVMPCRNEATAIKSVFKDLPREIDEIIVVDNNSSDQTTKIAKKIGAKIIHEPRTTRSGIGYGYALQKGIERAKGDIIVCMDGDGSYPVKETPQLIKHLLNRKLDFLSCNRLPFEDPKKMSLVRSFGVRVLNSLIGVLYGYKIKDSLSGMWVFKRHVYDELRPTEGGWNFSLEIKLKTIVDSRFKFSEKQIPYHDRVFDSSKQNIFRTGMEHVVYLFSLKRNLLSLAKLNRIKEGPGFDF